MAACINTAAAAASTMTSCRGDAVGSHRDFPRGAFWAVL